MRISSDRQIDNTSLSSQEEICRRYCETQGFEVVDINRNESVSANNVSSVRIEELLNYCKRRQGRFDVLVVYKFDRFARGVEQHYWLKGQLSKIGVHIRSATENVDSTPTGKLMEGILASFNEFDNELRKERIKLGLSKRTDEGLWAFAVPDGYIRDRNLEGKLEICRIDENCAGEIKKIFQLYSSGAYTVQSLSQEFRNKHVKNRKGKVIRFGKQSIYKILNTLFYTGYMKNSEGRIIQGKHPALIDMSLFTKCQEILNQKTNNTRKQRQHFNPDFPLRKFTVCGACLKPITACWAKGRNGKVPYYYCLSKTCSYGYKTIKKSDLESHFYDYLKTVKPTEPFVKLFKEVFIKKYEIEEQSLRGDYVKKCDLVKQLEEKRSWLLEKGQKGVLSDDVLQRELNQIKNEMALLMIDMNDNGNKQLDIDALLTYATNFIQTAEKLFEPRIIACF